MPIIGQHAASIRHDPHILQPQVLSVRTPSDRNQYVVGLEQHGVPTGSAFHCKLNALSSQVGLHALRLQPEVMPCLVSARCNAFAASSSTPGQMRSRYSTTVDESPNKLAGQTPSHVKGAIFQRAGGAAVRIQASRLGSSRYVRSPSVSLATCSCHLPN